MRRNFLEVQPDASSRALAFATPLGLMARILAASPSHSRFNLRQHISEILIPAISHRQFEIFFDQRGDPVGYVVWATVTSDVEDRFLGQALWRIHISEWNDEGKLWIIDFAAPYGHGFFIIKKLLESTLSKYSTCRFARIKGNRIVAKEIDREGALRLLHRKGLDFAA